MAKVLDKVAVCGAGAMGAGIAQVAAQAGASVKIFDVNADTLVASRERTLADLRKLEERGKLTTEAAAQIAARMEWVSSLEALADRGLVIEAIVEDEGVKAKLFEALEAVVSSDAIIATNTSSLPVSRLARSLKAPGRFVGMHFFNPATVMKLVEVIAGVATEADVAARIVATAEHWGKAAIPVADVPGFIVNRVARPFYAEAFSAFGEAAAEPEVIDALFKAAGFRMGPLELTDLIGQDVNFTVARSVFDSYFGRTRFTPQRRQAALVDAGWLGRKTGTGVYDYRAGGAPPIAPALPEATPGADARQAAEALLAGADSGFVDLGGVAIGRTRGFTAHTERGLQGKSVALLDWFAAEGAGAVGFAASDDQARQAALALLGALSRPALEISDRPGLIVTRTLAQIVNAAADAVLEQVATEVGVDTALRFGANYPFGPFAWADLVGRREIVTILDAIAVETGEALYRPAHYLRKDA